VAQIDDRLMTALKQARLAESAHREALISLADAEGLRLRVLQEDVEEALAGQPLAAGLLDLALAPGEKPKLWIDLISFVTMAEDSPTYRFIEEGRGEAQVRFETRERSAMADFVVRHIAHRLVARERLAAAMDRAGQASAGAPAAAAPAVADSSLAGGYSAAALIYAWTSGFALAFIALGIAYIILKRLVF